MKVGTFEPTGVEARLGDCRVPVIETARLILRGHTAADLCACSAMWADPGIARYIGGKPASTSETWSKMLRYRGLWELLGFGYWAIEEKATRQFVGEAGFADFKRDLDPPLDGAPEIGWAIVSAAQGRGYATEAVQAAIAWGDRHFGGRRTSCIIAPDNAASRRVAQKMGYREAHQTVAAGNPVIVFYRG